MQTKNKNANCPAHPPRDRIGIKLGTCRLTQVLQLVRENRWIADWLYPSEGSAAHPSLTPEAFQGALGLRMSHSLTQGNYDSEEACGAPNKSGPPKTIMSKEMNMLVVPVATADHCTVGYTFCSGQEYTRITGYTPVTTAKGRHYIMSRFAYDTRARQFLNVSPNMSSNISGIFQMIFHCDGSCERNFLAVPKLYYTADHLPKVVITSQCNLETRDLSSARPTFQFPDPNPPSRPSRPDSLVTELGDSMDDFFREINSFSANDNAPLPFGAGDPLLDPFVLETSPMETSPMETTPPPAAGALVPSPPPGKWPFGADGTTDDGVGVPRKPGPASTSAGIFDMSAMADSLAKLERSMKGNFFALRAKRDIMDPETGELLSRQTGHQISLVETLPAAAAVQLRSTAAQYYYASFMSPTIDATLVSPTIQNAAQRVLLPPPPPTAAAAGQATSTSHSPLANGLGITDGFPDALLSDMSMTHTAGSPTVSSNDVVQHTGAHTLAPRPVHAQPVKPIKAAVPTPVLTPVDKAEAKKIRNRLSAAKSNQKRRAQIEAQKKELVVLHLRVEELKKKKQQIVAENEMLRSQFFGAPLEELS